MAAFRYSLDTNILVYGVDRDAGDKHALAVELLDSLVDRDCVLSLQVLAEFFHVVTRIGHIPINEAREIVDDWMVLFPLVSAEGQHLKTAIRWAERGVFSLWDGLLFATVSGAGVTCLLTEDMQHGFDHSGTRVINPFSKQYDGDASAVLRG